MWPVDFVFKGGADWIFGVSKNHDQNYTKGSGKMNRKFFLIAAIVLLVVGIVVVPALAGPPQEASGTWYYHPSQEPVVRVAGGNQHMEIADFGW